MAGSHTEGKHLRILCVHHGVTRNTRHLTEDSRQRDNTTVQSCPLSRSTESKRGVRAIEAHEHWEAKRARLSRAELNRKAARAAEGEVGGGEGGEASDEGVGVVGVEEEEEVVEEAAYIVEDEPGLPVSPVPGPADDEEEEALRRSGRVRQPSSKQASQLRKEAKGRKDKKEKKAGREVRAKLKKTPT